MAKSLQPSYQKINLDPAFPVRAIHMHSTPGRDLFYCHWHRNIEIVHVTHGQVQLYIDNNLQTLNTGDICIINPNQVHYGDSSKGSDASVHLVILSYDILPYSHDDHIYQKYIAPLSSGDLLLPTIFEESNKTATKDSDLYDNCYKLLLRLIDYGDRPFSGREIAIQGTFLELIATLHHGRMFIKASTTEKHRIDTRNMAILDFVESNFTKKLNIEDIADHFNINEDYFYRLFKKYTGQTPVTFIHQLRTRYAKQLLRNTDMSISEISYQVGFGSSSYFTKLFNRYEHLSPSKYRKQYNSK